MKDADTILRELAERHPFLAPRIEDTQIAIEQARIETEIERTRNKEEDEALARHWQNVQREHEADIARHGSPWESEKPSYNGVVSGELMLGKGTTLSLWVDNQSCKGMLKCFPINKSFYLDFCPLETGALETLYSHWHTPEQHEFARRMNLAFVDEAREHSATFHRRHPAYTYQASTVTTSQFQESALVPNALVRLYWVGDQPVRAIVMDGDHAHTINITAYRGQAWNSPSHNGSL